ncbi:MAG TPA: protein kinase [Gemmataceae bacterium]|nr:protein kinase [Gemmataceae bacterium]
MPSPTTIDEFLDLVRKSGVVEDKRLTTYLDKLRASQPLPSEPGRLAGLLVRDGMLTHFQAEQFLQGKWRRFTIGKYKVLERLGSGGMGAVYLCEHKLMRRRVAVKVLPTAKADDTSSLERFYREARAVAALDHPNIVRAYDIDQDDKLHFLVMEHVDGSSLQEMVKKAGPMDVLRACHYMRQAALGLQHAHETKGIVHRDIKPGNILVDRNGIVKILDMGLARFFHDEDDILTKKFEENVLGTADYLAPEQALDSHSVDIRADIYSLGATFYFCLTGRTPFAEGTVAQKLIWHQTRQPKPLRQLRPEVPEGVAAIVEKMMAKDAGQRYPTPIAVAEVLAPWTQTPIPPPPENEMPQLSPAAMGTTPGESSLSGGPKTPSSGELVSSQRKVWQVSQTPSPTPPSVPPQPSPAPPAAPRDLRKTNPPPAGPLALQRPAANSTSAPAPVLRAPAAPQVRIASAPNSPASVPTPSASRPLARNGVAPLQPAPVGSPAEADEEPSWGALVAENGSTGSRSDTSPRASRRGPASSTKRVGGLPPSVPSRRLGWVIGITSLSVVGMIVAGGIIAWVLGKKTEPSGRENNEPAVFRVNRLGTADASSSLAAALRKIRAKGRQPARIVVQDDLVESDVVVDLPNIRIEAEAGKTIHWRPSSKAGTTKLLLVHKAENFHLKGFTLDGGNQVNILINLFHHCPGATLEDLKLQGFKQYGIWVTNCEGDASADRHVQLERLEFVTTQKEQTAVFFSIQPSLRDSIPKNKFFTFRDCKFDGPGAKVKTDDLTTLEAIDWPPGIAPVQGP